MGPAACVLVFLLTGASVPTAASQLREGMERGGQPRSRQLTRELPLLPSTQTAQAMPTDRPALQVLENDREAAGRQTATAQDAKKAADAAQRAQESADEARKAAIKANDASAKAQQEYAKADAKAEAKAEAKAKDASRPNADQDGVADVCKRPDPPSWCPKR